ncbi:eukaryotic translation initiation factor 2A isoform X1 [Syngnathus acus]|uniref:eukaryotic translation initiation factor 2A isoform X1 n=1 Tax=Syngnathus acus TaxID=161584 RepID=UPI0018861F4D|nr:eukaryotic translation initiation factor 2A isoform X1 [Syngnathus acus]
MAPPVPLLAVRESGGTSLFCGPPTCQEHAAFTRDPRASQYLTFSSDGSRLAWCNGKVVSVARTSDGSPVATLELPKTAMLRFSPLANILVTWQPYTKSGEAAQGDANLRLWELPGGGLLKGLFQKKADAWCPSWSQDEKMAVRMVSNELHFFEDNNFNVIANKLHVQKISNFELSPGAHPSKVCVYVPGSKGAPSFVRLLQYPHLAGPGAALASKSFFKADRVNMQWNNKASAVLVTASTEVDKSGASYYGEQTLHYLHVGGETAHVQLAKSGPIYDVAWSPNSSHFCVVYGFMPAKATVFNLKCDAVFDFGTGPRNAAYYSPQGHILVLAGFGNLRGQMEVWDIKKYKQVSKSQAADATHFSWCPDGEHVLTATCSPRLRVGNGFQVRHYTGGVEHAHQTPEGSELWEVRWQPFPDGTFPERPVRQQAAGPGGAQAAPAQAYRPPALRHLPAAPTSKLHEEEAPQNARSFDKPLSKAALKNQKKREARKAAKQESAAEPEPPSEPARVARDQSTETCDDPEMEKKLKNVKKKLKAIEELKEQQSCGKVLQKNQLEKLQKEQQLLDELKLLRVHQ